MNWDVTVAICAILGAFAAVLILVYLARQIKDSATQTKLNTTHTYASLIQDGFAPVYNNALTLRAWTVGNTEPSALNAIERSTYLLLMDRQLNNALPLATHYKAGAMSRIQLVEKSGGKSGTWRRSDHEAGN